MQLCAAVQMLHARDNSIGGATPLLRMKVPRMNGSKRSARQDALVTLSANPQHRHLCKYKQGACGISKNVTAYFRFTHDYQLPPFEQDSNSGGKQSVPKYARFCVTSVKTLVLPRIFFIVETPLYQSRTVIPWSDFERHVVQTIEPISLISNVVLVRTRTLFALLCKQLSAQRDAQNSTTFDAPKKGRKNSAQPHHQAILVIERSIGLPLKLRT